MQPRRAMASAQHAQWACVADLSALNYAHAAVCGFAFDAESAASSAASTSANQLGQSGPGTESLEHDGHRDSVANPTSDDGDDDAAKDERRRSAYHSKAAMRAQSLPHCAAPTVEACVEAHFQPFANKAAKQASSSSSSSSSSLSSSPSSSSSRRQQRDAESEIEFRLAHCAATSIAWSPHMYVKFEIA
jgi:hypothetical protein